MPHIGESPDISVVLPTYNRARYLNRAIDSVLRQTFSNFELIVVDDGSTDDTKRVLARVSDERVRCIHFDKNLGAPAARNAGIRSARAALIAFQDSDDEWLPSKLARQIECLSKDPRARAVYCGMIRVGDNRAYFVPEPDVAPAQGRVTAPLLRHNFISTQMLVAEKSLLMEIGGFDERLPRLQDWDLALRLSLLTDFALVPEPLVIAYETPGSISTMPLKEAVARRIILDKLRDTFRTAPDSLSRHLYIAGRIFIRQRRRTEARRSIMDAIREWPLNWRAWAALPLLLIER